MTEVWKDVKGYEGLYLVSNTGRVMNSRTKKILKLDTVDDYYVVGLYQNGKQKRMCVHNLVANSFLDNSLGLIRVTHLDGNKKNNDIQNLAFCGLVYGVGINDVHKSTNEAKNIWIQMLSRCYDKKQSKYCYYEDCTVCEEWLRYSNFLKWFESPASGFVKGHQLDKDLLVKGNRIYSSNTCCFVPQEINKAIVTKRNKKDGLPLGVSFLKGRNLYAGIGLNSSYKRFNTAEEAHTYYVTTKEKHIKELAEKYKNVITEKVYNALMEYKVE